MKKIASENNYRILQDIESDEESLTGKSGAPIDKRQVLDDVISKYKNDLRILAQESSDPLVMLEIEDNGVGGPELLYKIGMLYFEDLLREANESRMLGYTL